MVTRTMVYSRGAGAGHRRAITSQLTDAVSPAGWWEMSTANARRGISRNVQARAKTQRKKCPKQILKEAISK